MSELLRHLAIKGFRKPPEVTLSDDDTTVGGVIQTIKFDMMSTVNYLRHEVDGFVLLAHPVTLAKAEAEIRQRGGWLGLRLETEYLNLISEPLLEEGVIVVYPKKDNLTVKQIQEVISTFEWPDNE